MSIIPNFPNLPQVNNVSKSKIPEDKKKEKNRRKQKLVKKQKQKLRKMYKK